MENADNDIFSRLLLDWYDQHARDLPWRRLRTPYSTWISEVMLQQTQANTVIPYYEKFIHIFPDVQALSNSSLDEVLSHWAGLGYYSRAKNLKRGAEFFVQHHTGKIPCDRIALLEAPGIGPYIAGAILSMAYNQPEPAIDGNLIRVVSRLFALLIVPGASDAYRTVKSKLDKMIPIDRPGDFNEAMMDIGATICSPKSPSCEICPFSELCNAHLLGKETDFPLKKAPTKIRIEDRSIILMVRDNHILLRRRPEQGLLGGLYEFPSVTGHFDSKCAISLVSNEFGIHESQIASVETLENDSFKFSHLVWEMKALLIHLHPTDITSSPLLFRETQSMDESESRLNILSDTSFFCDIEKAAGLAFPTALKTYKNFMLKSFFEQKQ